MKKFNIEIISKKPEKIDSILSHWGKITIGNFSERFVMPLDSWTLDQYKQQWKEGLKKIKENSFSCLVTTIQNLDANSLIEFWVMYKESNVIYFQNEFLNRIIIKEEGFPSLSSFNRKTCYNYIQFPRQIVTKNGEKISEWGINIDDFYTSLENRS